MLPGVGIFGSDPISKVLIQLLQHFEFEIHGIWTNRFEIDSTSFFSSKNSTVDDFPKLITTSIDNVLLNKNVNLVFVCCQPNLHPQICSKALGIGKNVICLFPTCKDLDSICGIINSARYYPSLMSSINYGGLRFLSEFKLIKQYISLIGDIKLCNIVINCQNIAIVQKINSRKKNSSESPTKPLLKTQAKQGSLSCLVDNIAYVASNSTSNTALNWQSDRDLGAGVLNRYGAAMISLMLHLFDDKKVTKVYGSLKTFIDDLESCDETTTTSNFTDHTTPSYRPNSLDRTKSDKVQLPVPNHQSTIDQRSRSTIRKKSQIRKITADDHCTFQMRLDSAKANETTINNKKTNILNSKNSIMVTVVINSLAQCKYSQEIVISGNKGSFEWKNSKLIFRSTSIDAINEVKKKHEEAPATDSNNNNTSMESLDFSDESEATFYETELRSNDPLDEMAEHFLKPFRNLECKYPELPLLYIKGLYYYLANVKNSFLEKQKETQDSSPTANKSINNVKSSLENFEHTHLVQNIVKSIAFSNECNRWVPVNY